VSKYLFKPLLVFFLATTILIGCSHAPAPPIPDNKVQTVGIATGAVAGAALGAFTGVASAPATAFLGGITGGAIGHYLAARDTLFTNLDRDHLQIVRVGEEYMIYLPSDVYFHSNSTHINESFYPALDNIATFIRMHETELIKIAGYTDNIGNKTRNVALSRQQAQNIMNYLSRQGLNARMMYSAGYGEQFPVATNQSEEGRAANRRVQITFRAVPKDSENI